MCVCVLVVLMVLYFFMSYIIYYLFCTVETSTIKKGGGREALIKCMLHIYGVIILVCYFLKCMCVCVYYIGVSVKCKCK